MVRRKKHKRKQEEVTLNLAAMLDMAFQLLAFFILTYRPAPVEGQISLRMPPPIPLKDQKGAEIGGGPADNDALRGLNRVVVGLYSTDDGEIRSVTLGDGKTDSRALRDRPTVDEEIAQLAAVLPKEFAGTGRDEMVINAGSGLRYEQLMRVVDVCARLEVTDPTTGKKSKLTKLTYAELDDGSFPGDPRRANTKKAPPPKAP